MKDDSPIVLHIDVGDTTYDFFLFSIMVYDIIIYDNEFNSKASMPTVSNSPGADKLIDYLPSRFPGLTDDWVTGYLQNAGYVFDNFRQQFGGSPKMDALLHRITSINTWKGVRHFVVLYQ